MRPVFSLLICLFVFSCQQDQTVSLEQGKKLDIVEAKGYGVPKERIQDPVTIQVDQSSVKKVPVGKPRVIKANRNVHPAGKPTMKPAGSPVICTPGQNGYSSPQDSKATGRTIPAGEPEVIVAREMAFKDQNPASFRYFSKLQGLKTIVIHTIFEDRAGNIWFGTESGGVTRFDGKNFSHFTSREGLSSDKVASIAQDRSGSIWFGTLGGGLTCYDGRTFRQFTTSNGLCNDTVNCMLLDRSGDLWFGTNGGGACKYDGASFTVFTSAQGLGNDKVTCILEDRQGNLWFGTEGGGVSKYDGQSFFRFTTKEGLSLDEVTSMIEDRRGNLWIGTDGGGANKFDGVTFQHFTTAQGLSDDVIMSMLEDRSGNLWFGTYGQGVACLNGEDFSHYTTHEGLSHDIVSCMLQDRSGNVWFGTLGGGINRFDGNLFSHITTREGLNNNAVSCIMEDRFGNLWFGTHGGAIRFDGSSYYQFTTQEGLTNNTVSCMLEDKHGRLWFGTYEGGVNCYDGKTFSQYTTQEGLSHNDVTCMLEDRSGNIWFGTFGGGVSRFDGKAFSHFTILQGLSNDYITCILEDRKGHLWLGTSQGGINRFNGDSLFHYTTKQGLSSDDVLSSMEDRSGNLWFGTSGGGVVRYDGKVFTRFTSKEGLSNDDILSMLEEGTMGSGKIWFGSRSGLNVSRSNIISQPFHSENPHVITDDEIMFKSYGYNDGFLGVGCNRTAILRARDGKLWVGSNDRLTVVNTEPIHEDTIAPTIQLTGLELFNDNISWQNLTNKKDTSILLGNGVRFGKFSFDSISRWYNVPEGLSLAHNNNFLNFRYIGITMHQPEKVQYRYKLEGIDDNWSALTKQTEAPYGNLPQGTYTFKVKAMNSEGYWSPEYAYTFTIRPPWWKTPAAYGAYSALFLFVYVGSLRWNARRVRKRTLVLKQAVDDATAQIRLQQEWEMRKLQDENLKNIVKTQEDERVRIGRDLHDDLGARLSTLKLMLQSVFKKEGAPQEPVRESSLSMLDSAIRDMRGIITNLAPKSLQDNGYLKAVEELVNTIAKTETITFELSMHGMDRRFESEFENSLFRITQELINNSLKYANASRITIGVIGDHEKIRLTYEDDGTGIDPDKMNKGYGLNNIRARATLYKGDFYIDTATAKGFRCEITLYPPD